MKRQSTISTRLFKSYGVLFGVFFSALFLISLIYVGLDINKKVIVSQETAFDTVVKQTEIFFEEAYDFSSMLSTSTDFKNIATNQLPMAYDQSEYQGQYFKQLYLIANKMLIRNYRIAIQLKSGKYIWMGNNYFIHDISQAEKAVFSRIGLGNLKVEKIEENLLLKSMAEEKPYFLNDIQPCISLKRDLTISYDSYAPIAVLDIQVPCGELEQMMDSVVYSRDMAVTIYNSDGQILYGPEQEDITVRWNNNSVQRDAYERNGRKIQIEPLLNSKLYIVGTISKAKLYRPWIVYLAFVIVMFVLLGVGLLFFTYRLSVKITSPIKEMCGKIRKINFDGDNWIEYTPVYCDVRELNFLSDTVARMQNKLRLSMDEAIKLRDYEMQSRMLALQAQMQPHFLYNTLMTISAIAEEAEDFEVARICSHLTRMLRYISSEESKGVTLSKELAHVRDYVECMKERFPETEVLYDIPLSMMYINIPKLVVQPLVENSLKYCNRLDCKIKVIGEMEGNRFRISISDNGEGFTDEKIKEIMEYCRHLVEGEEFSVVKIDGMGLANIYARLYLFYKEDMLFQIHSFPGKEQGSCIEIGGIVDIRKNF